MSIRRHTPVVFESLVADATMAASSHNTQPWRFEIGENLIRIVPDFTRRCPMVDPDDHHLYVSLGCAAENMVLAAASKGWVAVVEVRSSGDAHWVDVMLHPGTPVASPLADAIPRRQCTRAPYDGRQASVDDLLLLERAASGNAHRCPQVPDTSAKCAKRIQYQGILSHFGCAMFGLYAPVVDLAWASRNDHRTSRGNLRRRVLLVVEGDLGHAKMKTLPRRRSRP